MTPPLVTAICLAYGRAANVEQAIAMFLAQDYPNKRMVVLNTFEQQLLIGGFPNVRIHDVARPSSLGECRNLAIAHAGDEDDNTILCTWDDDDFYHSRHLSTIAKHFTEGIEWVWLDSMFFTEKGEIRKITTGSPNCLAITKRLWKSIGGYPDMNTGEDKAVMSKVSQFPGVRVATKPEEITFCYGWDNGQFHISGHGFDEPGAKTGYEKVREQVELDAAAGRIPTGEIILKPNMRLDPDKMISDWLEKNHHVAAPESNEVCLVELGRYGDICNILPVAHAIAKRFDKPFLMVSREFADILDGVSYVEPFITDLRQDQVNEAAVVAKRRFKNVLVTQVWGHNYSVEHQCFSYNRESWRLAGFGHKFDDHSWKPVFDRRDQAREYLLLSHTCPKDTPLLLVNVTRGVSSPYDKGLALLDAIKARFRGPYNVVDIAQLRLERIYDVLGLMERAVALVCVDTSFLHLAPAADCPTIAIVNDKPWLGTELRADNFIRFTYADSVETIIAGMEKELSK